MEVRKVQLTGGKSLTVTLPKDWTNMVGLTKNDSIKLEPNPDGTLTLYPQGSSKIARETSKTIDLDQIPNADYLFRVMLGAYISGHDSIILKSKGPIDDILKNEIFSFTQSTIGLETIEEEDDRIMLNDLVNHEDIVLNKNLDRMRALVKNMISRVFNDAFTDDTTLVKDIESKDAEVDRAYWFISRECSLHQKDITLSQRTGTGPDEIWSIHSLARIMERIGDHAVLVSTYSSEVSSVDFPSEVHERLQDVGGRIANLFLETVENWRSKDIKGSNDCIEDAEYLILYIRSTFKKSISLTLEHENAINRITSSAIRIAEYCIDISELTINAAMN